MNWLIGIFLHIAVDSELRRDGLDRKVVNT